MQTFTARLDGWFNSCSSFAALFVLTQSILLLVYLATSQKDTQQELVVNQLGPILYQPLQARQGYFDAI